jgi:hypothetical protein
VDFGDKADAPEQGFNRLDSSVPREDPGIYTIGPLELAPGSTVDGAVQFILATADSTEPTFPDVRIADSEVAGSFPFDAIVRGGETVDSTIEGTFVGLPVGQYKLWVLALSNAPLNQVTKLQSGELLPVGQQETDETNILLINNQPAQVNTKIDEYPELPFDVTDEAGVLTFVVRGSNPSVSGVVLKRVEGV